MAKSGWFKWSICTAGALAAVAIAIARLSAADAPGQGLPALIRGNEHFGRVLLEKVHRSDPEHNVVVSPISVTIIMAAIRNSTGYSNIYWEISNAFGLRDSRGLAIPARMLLAAFDGPKPEPEVPPGPLPGGISREILLGMLRRNSQEGSWITNTLVYGSKSRGADLNPFDPFVADASKYFGVKFVATGDADPTAEDLKAVRKSVGPLPQVSPENNAWIASGTHLRTSWEGNTFSMSKPFTGEFRTAGGDKRQVEMITSEFSEYAHAKTEAFEAVVLPCDSAYMVVVLPAPGNDIHELEKELADSPETLDSALKKENGLVTIPKFHRSETDLRPPLLEMGIEKVFHDLGPMIRFDDSYLSDVVQKVDLQVDGAGIRASAETVAGVIYGGIQAGTTAFKMRIDRPFLFLIRDNNADALLFIGAVMDPSK